MVKNQLGHAHKAKTTKKKTKTTGLVSKYSGMFTRFIWLFGLAFDITHAVLKISLATMPHALGRLMGSDIQTGSHLCI